jgi:BirA family biotin operon repressor/biotin-[acetyl-CoA-carboxylase] ligase
MNLNILRYEEIDSTSSEAARQARRGAAEGTCVIARSQSAGRGRYGRAWVSDKDAGLYYSLVLRPAIEARYLPLVTLMAGIAVHDTLADLGLKPDIKWVNDILVGDKKISGILCEAIETSAGQAVIVGIGINIASTTAYNEISSIATSAEAELGTALSADQFSVPLTSHICRLYDTLCGGDGPGEIVHLWQMRSTYFTGKHVRVTVAGERIDGVTDGLEDNGALRLRTAAGDIKIIEAGDVELLRKTND